MGNVYNTGDTPIYEKTANKDVASGYMGLDASSVGNDAPKVHALRGTAHSDGRLPTGIIAESLPRNQRMDVNGNVDNAGRLQVVGVEIQAGSVISTISHVSGSTPASVPTHQWFGLYSGARAKLAVTADDGVTAWAANTEKKLYVSRTVTDAVATSGSAIITSATAAFTASDVGKQITFMGAGAAGVPFGTSASRVTVLSVDSATQIHASANAGTSVASNGTLYIATPYTTLTTGLFYIAFSMTATTAINTTGIALLTGGAVINALPPILGGYVGASFTLPSNAPDPANAFTADTAISYAYVA